jgi:hypothetical protein
MQSLPQCLEFLDVVWPDTIQDHRPDFVIFDKVCVLIYMSQFRPNLLHLASQSCQLLKYIATQNMHSLWLISSHFIVDAFHYITHRATDLLCCEQCNPAARDGSQPDLVYALPGPNGTIIYVCAFNGETAEQLNSWFGGYEGQLNRMTDYNHDFFVQCVLLLYTDEWEARREEEEEKRRGRSGERD